MNQEIFRPGYSPADEFKFKRALKAGKFEDALRALESFPYGKDEDDEVERAVALVQGYRALAQTLLNQNPEVRRLGRELEAYRLRNEALQKRVETQEKEYQDLRIAVIEEGKAHIETEEERRRLASMLGSRNNSTKKVRTALNQL